MCGGGSTNIFGGASDILSHPLDLNRWVYYGFGGKLGHDPNPSPSNLKPPKLNIDTAKADAAAAHQKDLLAAAFGLNDTKLTGQQGLGSVPKSLLTPKTTLGGY